MVYEYGMGTTIRSHQVPADDFNVSEVAAPDAATRRSRRSPRRPTAAPTELLTDHRDLLDEIAERLLANEVIEHDEIQRDHGRAATRARREPPTELRRRRPTPAAAAAAEALAAQPSRRAEPEPTPAPLDSRPMFELIDHVGVAVDDLDAALALYEGTLRDAARPPRDGRPSRASRRCCSTSATATSSCCSPLGPETAGRQVPRPQGRRACTTSPTRSTTSRPTLARARRAAGSS